MLLTMYLSVKIDIYIHFQHAKLQELRHEKVEANSESRMLCGSTTLLTVLSLAVMTQVGMWQRTTVHYVNKTENIERFTAL